MDRKANGTAKAELTNEEIAAVRAIVDRDGVKGAGSELVLARGTVLRILSGLPVHNLTASHLRTKLRI